MTTLRTHVALVLGPALCLSAALPLQAPGVPDDVAIASTTARSSSEWVAQPPLHHPRTGHGVATVRGQILAIGGFDFDPAAPELDDSVEARRLSGSGAWHFIAPMPTLRANLGVGTLGGIAYAVGGYPDGVNATDVVETFDPRSGRWATSRPLPQPRARPGAAGMDGLLYVAGGSIPLADQNLVLNTVVAYNPHSDTWNDVAPMPTARDSLRLVASGRYLYAIGGADVTGQSLSTVERYDPRSDSWRTMNPMHESRYLPCAVETSVGGRRILVVVAGAQFTENGEFIDGLRTTEVFHLATGRWTLLDVLLPVVQASHDCAVQPDGTILAIGGASHIGPDFISLANVEALSLRPRDLRP